MARRFRSAVFLALLIALLPRGGSAAELTLSVAISLKEAVQDIARAFAERHRGAVVRSNLGGSGELRQQIEAGAPVDAFLSAAEDQMDILERQRLILPKTRHTFAHNALTVVTPVASKLKLNKLADLADKAVERIAIGNPKTVPAGMYAAEGLRRLGIWDALQAKLVYAENVRQVLEYAARGEVDAAFVYVTDVRVRSRQVVEAFRLPSDSYPPVRYPAAVTAASRQVKLATDFIGLLLSPEGQASLTRRGFLPRTKEDR